MRTTSIAKHGGVNGDGKLQLWVFFHLGKRVSSSCDLLMKPVAVAAWAVSCVERKAAR